jgi:hypothetical protein
MSRVNSTQDTRNSYKSPKTDSKETKYNNILLNPKLLCDENEDLDLLWSPSLPKSSNRCPRRVAAISSASSLPLGQEGSVYVALGMVEAGYAQDEELPSMDAPSSFAENFPMWFTRPGWTQPGPCGMQSARARGTQPV